MATDSSATLSSYDLRIDSLLSFHDRLAAFKDGSDTPRAYLERCLAVIDMLEGEINSCAALNIEGCSCRSGCLLAQKISMRPLICQLR